MGFFSNLVGEEGPRVPRVKDCGFRLETTTNREMILKWKLVK